MQRLVLDSIIYGLQRFGGISNFWSQLITAHPPFDDIDVLLPRTIRAGELPDMAGATVRRERLATPLSRYLPVSTARRGDVFHTSYYRRPLATVDRYVTSVYDFTYERYFSGMALRVHHHQKAASIHAADLSICISEATRSDLLAQFPRVDPSRTRVVSLGVNTTDFYPDPSPRRSAPYVLFVGQRQGYKRFDLALAAVAQVPDLSLAIVGPPLSGEEKSLIERQLLGRWREHAGVGRDALRRLYSDAFAFLFPSDYEGFGLPILEAMACNCPVVAADRSSFPEVAGPAALLATRQDADAYAELLHRLHDRDLREQLVRLGAERVALFNWQRCFEQLWKCYGRR